MNLAEPAEELKQRHQALQSEIDDEATRPHPDEAHLAVLKKQKLKIKDQIADH